tara:strand:- start:441 stop:743 length:303 start_codon:yes stop_codon:yes gene_type:complete
LDGELNALLEKFEAWEQSGPEALTEYQNYKVGAKSHTGGQQRRPGSVTATSRLLRPTHASKNKQLRDGDSEDEYGSENGSDDLDDAARIKMEIEKMEEKI